MKRTTLLLVFILILKMVNAQQPDSIIGLKDIRIGTSELFVKPACLFSTKSVIPDLLVLYGVASLRVKGLKDINIEVKEEILENNQGFRTPVDNYLQFTPAAGAFLLEAGGIKGKHNLKGKAIIYSIGLVIMTGAVYSLKTITHELRPNGSKYNSFPSGHTANAFMGAAFLQEEYAFRSALYGYAGYTAAAGTGVLRMYNNKHWFADVLAGAGIGILSTKASYWIFNTIKNRQKLKYARKTLIRF